MISTERQLELFSLEKELDRALDTYGALQTRVNAVMALSVTFTATLIGILGAILKFAETSGGWQPIATYLPLAGLLSMILAWRFARGIRKEFASVLKEATDVEAARSEIVRIPVSPFHRRLRQENAFWGMNRETYVILLIALGWGSYALHTYPITQWMKALGI